MELIPVWTSAVIYGLTAGLAPGATTALVISQTLRFGVREGMKVGIAPALTDAPIIAVAWWIVGRLAAVEPWLGTLSLLGAGFLFFLGASNLNVHPPSPGHAEPRPRSLLKGVLANGVNPHAYLFWFTIGAPTLVAPPDDPFKAVGFILLFYVCMIGTKLALAWITHRGRRWLHSRAYVWLMRGLGIALLGFGVLFLRDGLRLLGVFGE